jgi:hypothetical protein
MKVEPIDLLVLLRTFVQLQLKLITALKAQLGAKDWHLLIDVPRRGQVELEGRGWRYSVHGTGIRFDGGGCSVDANRGLGRFPSAFDAGRIVEYVRSKGTDEVSWRGSSYRLDYDSTPSLLRQLAESGDIVRVAEADGELYVVPR